MNFTPSFNAVNDRPYLQSNYDAAAGQFRSSIPNYIPNFFQTPPAMAPSAPAVSAGGGMPSGGDYFAQLAGLMGMAQGMGASPSGNFYSNMGGRTYQAMGTPATAQNTDPLSYAKYMMPPTTGYRYDGGTNPLEQETRQRVAKEGMARRQAGQMGRASGGRTATGYPQRPAQGFQPSTNFGKPRASEGFGDGRGFGSFR